MENFPVEISLFVLLLVIALVIATVRDLFEAAMLFSIFSLLSAGLFVMMDAVDVAFTEAAIGAGISTILILGALSLTSEEEFQSGRHRVAPVVLVLLTGAALIYGTLDMPLYGDPAAPIHHHVAPRYIQESPKEIGIPNFVTAVLASYRGFDTYGETMVIFTAGVGVMLLLGGRSRAQRKWKDS